jgi:Concanavalin A-like lectin/glucanases superfamily
MKRTLVFFLLVLLGTTLFAQTQNCLDFDGIDDYVDCGTASLGGSITVEAWIYPTDVSSDWAGIAGKHNISNERVFWLGQHSTDGVLRFGIYLNGDTETALDTDTAVITNNRWYHIAATYDGHYQKIFVDGELVKSSVDHNTTLPTGTSNYFIGRVPVLCQMVPSRVILTKCESGLMLVPKQRLSKT